MAGDAAEQAGSSLKRRNPGLQARASGNEINYQEEIVMSDISTAASNVIPFNPLPFGGFPAVSLIARS
ncbi:hypothetical protein [Pseudomonas costantinii]|uniref:hypothetical protein n=1 Tax=Pseudomonas costantinii TaxID=168469 RepID=UPI001C433399|nr:hypothetical protein [Pseudomonas costantinii]